MARPTANVASEVCGRLADERDEVLEERALVEVDPEQLGHLVEHDHRGRRLP